MVLDKCSMISRLSLNYSLETILKLHFCDGNFVFLIHVVSMKRHHRGVGSAWW